MTRVLRRRPHLERLEVRDCPSLTVSLISGSLTISGTPMGALLVQETAPASLKVTDGAANLGTYHVTGDLRMMLNSHPSTVRFDVNGNRFGGNVLINVGNGKTNGNPDQVEVFSGLPGGSVGGSVTMQNGSGQETFAIGSPSFPNDGAIAVGGNVSVSARVSGGTAGNTFFVTAGSSVGGDVTSSHIDNVQIGLGLPGAALTTVGGNVSISDVGSGLALNAFDFGNIGRSLSVTGTSLDDIFSLQQVSPGVGGQVNGSLSVNLGSSVTFGDDFTLGAGTSVGGNATLSTQGVATSAFPNFDVAGAVNGSLTLNLGDGGNMVNFEASATVAGNMTVNGGNGNNDLSTFPFSGTVAGSLSFNLGNGDNSVTITTAPGGLLSWTSGNGASALTLNPAAATAWDVNVHFGSNDDSFTLAGAGGTLSGLVDGGGHVVANTFTQGAGWTLTNFTLVNFP